MGEMEKDTQKQQSGGGLDGKVEYIEINEAIVRQKRCCGNVQIVESFTS